MSDNGKLVVQDEVVALFDTAKFEHMYRVAKLMASSDLMPKHLMGKEANCMLIVQQALRWKMDPFAMAQGTFVVSNKLGYEGKVVAAVVNTRAALKDRLKYDVSGEGQNCSVVVRGTFQGEDEERTVEATWAEGKALSPHGAKWKELPDQQLCYYAARKWARRHCPELILGVLSDDEVEAMSRHVGPDYAKDVGGHSEAHKPIASLDALADQIETKAAPEPQESHQEAGDDIVDTDTGEVTEGAPEQPLVQHGMVHDQDLFTPEPNVVSNEPNMDEEVDDKDAEMAYWLSAQIVKARSKDRMLKDLEPKIMGLKGKIPAAQYTALINAFQEKFEQIQKSEKAA